MSGTKPDADEMAVRDRLRAIIDGVSQPDPAPVDEPAEAGDWWDRLYPDDEPDEQPVKLTKGRAEPAPAPDPSAQPAPAPAVVTASENALNRRRQSLLDAWDGLTGRTRWLIHHGTAAGFGWGLGIVTWATHVTAWVAADRYSDPQSITCYLIGLGAVALYRRARGWWWPVAWMAAIPVSSIVTGVLLYAPNS
jgi:hypothetical protein